jgi:asparagine synthase (glutamine-hydrolysing)
MTALAGIVRFDGAPADALSVANMIDCVAHRGTDWRQVWSQGSVAFGYRWRRGGSTQPIDTQPIVDRRTGIAIVFDGRLDNREQLGEKFLIDDLDRLSDAELVLAAYARRSGDSVAYLLGDFAFALWDPGSQRLLMAATRSIAAHFMRDRSGFLRSQPNRGS